LSEAFDDRFIIRMLFFCAAGMPQVADLWHLSRLRACREWQRSRRPAQKFDELAPPHGRPRGSRLIIVTAKTGTLEEVVLRQWMSALGHKRTCAVQKGMSALPPKADMCGAARDVRYGPKADIARPIRSPHRHAAGMILGSSGRAPWRSSD